MDSLQAPEESVNRQSVRCELHDLHYNPSEQAGCVLCLREERKAEKSRRVLLVVVGLLGVAFLVASVHQATRSDGGSDLFASADINGQPEDGAGVVNLPVKLDAEPYRTELTRIEEVLYRDAPATEADLDWAAAASRELAEKVRARQPKRSGRVVTRLLAWASNSLENEAGYSAPDIGRARSSWEQLRDELFVAAPWFAVADSHTEAAQNPAPPAVDQSVVASLRIVSNDVFHLISVGRLESDAIGEVVSDVNDPQVRQTRQRWRQWTRDWARQVQRAARKLPPPPALSSNINLLLAYQKTVSALNDLSLVPVGGGDEPVPYLYQRRSRFEAAEREAAEAEARLNALQ